MNSRRRAFTLVEMLVVIGIIAILAGLIMGVLAYVSKKAKVNATELRIKAVEAALMQYEHDFHDYPPSGAGADGVAGSESLLRCLTTEKNNEPYIRYADIRTCDANGNGQLEIADEWNRPIHYFHHRDYQSQSPNKQTYRLISAGPNSKYEDGAKGSDDIVNWDKDHPTQ